jgi:hypothetical protein
MVTAVVIDGTISLAKLRQDLPGRDFQVLPQHLGVTEGRQDEVGECPETTIGGSYCAVFTQHRSISATLHAWAAHP